VIIGARSVVSGPSGSIRLVTGGALPGSLRWLGLRCRYVRF